MVTADVLNSVTLEAHQCATHKDVLVLLAELTQGLEDLGKNVFVDGEQLVSIGIQPMSDHWLVTVTRMPVNGG